MGGEWLSSLRTESFLLKISGYKRRTVDRNIHCGFWGSTGILLKIIHPFPHYYDGGNVYGNFKL